MKIEIHFWGRPGSSLLKNVLKTENDPLGLGKTANAIDK